VCAFSLEKCFAAVARGPNGKITTHIHHNCMRDSLLYARARGTQTAMLCAVI
jgi:hypothetical protein